VLTRGGHQPLQDGQQEGGRLAGAGLGQSHEVASGGHVGDGFSLDGGGGFVTEAFDIGDKGGIQAKYIEAQKDILWQYVNRARLVARWRSANRETEAAGRVRIGRSGPVAIGGERFEEEGDGAAA